MQNVSLFQAGSVNISTLKQSRQNISMAMGNATVLDERKQRLDLIGHGIVVLSICIIGKAFHIDFITIHALSKSIRKRYLLRRFPLTGQIHCVFMGRCDLNFPCIFQDKMTTATSNLQTQKKMRPIFHFYLLLLTCSHFVLFK